jgi:hypothetical protein
MLEGIKQGLRLSSSLKGENVIVSVSKDRGVFLDAYEPVTGIRSTSPVQTYLDLSVGGGNEAQRPQIIYVARGSVCRQFPPAGERTLQTSKSLSRTDVCAICAKRVSRSYGARARPIVVSFCRKIGVVLSSKCCTGLIELLKLPLVTILLLPRSADLGD